MIKWKPWKRASIWVQAHLCSSIRLDAVLNWVCRGQKWKSQRQWEFALLTKLAKPYHLLWITAPKLIKLEERDWLRFEELFKSFNLIIYFLNLALRKGTWMGIKQIRLFFALSCSKARRLILASYMPIYLNFFYMHLVHKRDHPQNI